MWLLKIFSGSFLSSLTDGIKTIFGSQLDRDAQSFKEDTQVSKEMEAEETTSRVKSNWFDILIDAICRLPRPVGFFLTVWIFIWPLWNFENFNSAMLSYGAIPQWLGTLIITVWSLYFGGRFLSKDMNFGGVSSATVQNILAGQQKLHAAVLATLPPPSVQGPQSGPDSYPQTLDRGTETVEPLASARPISPQEYQKQMKDTTRPLSLDAIVAWNQQHAQPH